MPSQEFASQLLLQNSVTGYAFLLDKQNRVRWRGCGKGTDVEVKRMLELADQLAKEVYVRK